MLTHAASILRPYLQSDSRQDNPGMLSRVVLVSLAGVVGYGVYRLASGSELAKPKIDWIYWATTGYDDPQYLRWSGWVRRPDGQVIESDDAFNTREEAEDAARETVVKYGGNPVLSYGAPGEEEGAPGLEGAAPGTAPMKNNYVGAGWFWPHQDIFPSEATILQFMSSMGYATSGYEVLSAQNMEAARRWQADYNLVARYWEAGTPLDAAWPGGLVVDGLLGASSLQALRMLYLALSDPQVRLQVWRELVKEAKIFAAIPLAVKQILRLGYGTFAKWMKTNAAGRRAMISPFQDDYNCVIQSTSRTPIGVDGKVGPQTKDAASYAATLNDTVSEWSDYVAAC